MWERSTPELLPRVTPTVTRKLRHLGGRDAAGHGIGEPPRTAKRLWVARPGGCLVADDTTTHAGDRGAETAGQCEPDYRFTLANERTFLAWQRTALGLLAAAVALVQLVPELTIPGERKALGLLLAVLATPLAPGCGAGSRRIAPSAAAAPCPVTPRRPTSRWVSPLWA